MLPGSHRKTATDEAVPQQSENVLPPISIAITSLEGQSNLCPQSANLIHAFRPKYRRHHLFPADTEVEEVGRRLDGEPRNKKRVLDGRQKNADCISGIPTPQSTLH